MIAPHTHTHIYIIKVKPKFYTFFYLLLFPKRNRILLFQRLGKYKFKNQDGE